MKAHTYYKEGVYSLPDSPICVKLERTEEPLHLAKATVCLQLDENHWAILAEVQKVGNKPAVINVNLIEPMNAAETQYLSNALSWAASFARKLDRGE